MPVDVTGRPTTTADLVGEVRGTVLRRVDAEGGMTSYVGGYTASYVDLAALISERLLLVIGTVILLGFLLLMIAFRSLLIPLQAAVTNLLSAAAAFGVLTAAFQWGWGISLVGIDTPDTTVPIASYVPLMMFAVLFGLSMDYEVFLVSHIQQHHHEGEPATAGCRRPACGSSARITTAAALIMSSVFASFILNGDPTIKQFGVGLATAVLLAGILVVTLATGRDRAVRQGRLVAAALARQDPAAHLGRGRDDAVRRRASGGRRHGRPRLAGAVSRTGVTTPIRQLLSPAGARPRDRPRSPPLSRRTS